MFVLFYICFIWTFIHYIHDSDDSTCLQIQKQPSCPVRFYTSEKSVTNNIQKYTSDLARGCMPTSLFHFQTLWWLHSNFSTLSLFSGVCFCNWLKALPLIVSICLSIVWMRSSITDLAWGQLDFSWFNWIYDMSQTQTSRDCFAMTASLLHIKKSFHNALWLWALTNGEKGWNQISEYILEDYSWNALAGNTPVLYIY